MSLYTLLKNFCIEAHAELLRIGELPYRPYSSPRIAGVLICTHPLSKLKTYVQLKEYMDASGLADKLHDVGHSWIWHEEVFPWLFLEYVIQESGKAFLDKKAFDRVFRRAQAELSQPVFLFRRITVLGGMPEFKYPIILTPNIRLLPLEFSTSHYQVANLLGWQFHLNNRKPGFWGYSDSCLLIQDRIIKKGNHGQDFMNYRREVKKQTHDILSALKLSLESIIFETAVFASYLSRFPLLPISYLQTEQLTDVRVRVPKRHISLLKTERREISTCFHFIDKLKSSSKPEPQFFHTALERFASSFRLAEVEQNIVDLSVSLEALLDIDQQELRRTLSTRVAFLLGRNQNERRHLYNKTMAGYSLRNLIVHGKGGSERLEQQLKKHFPDPKYKKDGTQIYFGRALLELQSIVRRILRAYIYMRNHKTRAAWPKAEDFEDLCFDNMECRKVQEQLGLYLPRKN